MALVSLHLKRTSTVFVLVAALWVAATVCDRDATTANALLVPVTTTFGQTRTNKAHHNHRGPSASAAASSSCLSMAAASPAIESLSPLLVAEDGGSEETDVPGRLAGKRVALYFSAGWCPMCTSFEPALARFREAADGSGTPVELVYVASDRSAPEASKRAAALGMPMVPFEKAADYKKAFGVWAGSEALRFGFGGRRSGVPALVVLDPADGTELAFVAAESKGPGALGDWPLDDGVW